MVLSNFDIWSFPWGVSNGVEVKITLGLAAKKVLPINCLIFFSRQTDLLFIYGIFKVITHFSGPISLSFFKPFKWDLMILLTSSGG